jgi:hypothetical protein
MKKLIIPGLSLIIPHIFIVTIIPLSYTINPYNTFYYGGVLSVCLCILFISFSSYTIYDTGNYKENSQYDFYSLLSIFLFPILLIPLWYFILGDWMYWKYNAKLYIDNGSIDKRNVVVNGNDILVNGFQVNESRVPIGPLSIIYDDTVKRDYTIEKGSWVLNPGKVNCYIIKDVRYGKPSIDFLSFNFRKEPIKEEFFKADVDYMFNAPGSIKVKYSTYERRTVLLRISNDDKSSY